MQEMSFKKWRYKKEHIDSKCDTQQKYFKMAIPDNIEA